MRIQVQPARFDSLGDVANDRSLLGSAIAEGWNHDHNADGTHQAIHEYGRLLALGVWSDLSFLAQRFTGNNAMTWTLTAADQSSLRYTIIGNTMTVAWVLTATTVGGTPDTALQIALPSLPDGTRYRSTSQTFGVHLYSDNGTLGVGAASVMTRTAVIALSIQAATAWAASANNTTTTGQLTFEVETY